MRMVAVLVSRDPELEELIRLANQEDLGDVAGRLAEEILRLRRDGVVADARLRRLRNALVAAGVSEELVTAIEWDS